MAWTVKLSKRTHKQLSSLPVYVQDMLTLLVLDMEAKGAVQGTWPHYSKLGKERHHCHIRRGKPCYVAVWEVKDKKIQIIEVVYVGTHENAPY